MDNPSVKEDWAHNLEVKEYKAKRKVYNSQVLTWKENKAKCYYLVLSHCPLPAGVGAPAQEFF